MGRILTVANGYYFNLSPKRKQELVELIQQEKDLQNSIQIRRSGFKLAGETLEGGFIKENAKWRTNSKLIAFFEKNPLEYLNVLICRGEYKINYKINDLGLHQEELVLYIR